MNNKSLIVRFMAENSDWEKKLKEPPYKISVMRDGDLAILSYNIYGSDFSIPLVQEARGIIIDTKKLEVVCWPFRKFGNYGADYVDEIDWNTAKVQEKIDGSLMKLWYDHTENRWRISGNKNININTLMDFMGVPLEERVKKCLEDQGISLKSWDGDRNLTYMFEHVSPYNRIVIGYKDDFVYHLGSRNNLTGEECDIDIGVKKPELYPIHSIQECLEVARRLNPDDCDKYEIKHEGFVVVDRSWNRVKIKSPAYIEAHAGLRGLYTAGKPSKQRMIELILNEDDEEFVTLYPNQKQLVQHYKLTVKRADDYICKKVREFHAIWHEIMQKICENQQITEGTQISREARKEYAAAVKRMEHSDWAFCVLKGYSSKEIMREMHIHNRLIPLIEELERRETDYGSNGDLLPDL